MYPHPWIHGKLRDICLTAWLVGKARCIYKFIVSYMYMLSPQWILLLYGHMLNFKRYNPCILNSLRPRRNEYHFADDIFKRVFFNENVWISIKISLKFLPKGPINNIPALVQIMAWHRSGDKPLSEPMMVSLPTQICVTRPQWVN